MSWHRYLPHGEEKAFGKPAFNISTCRTRSPLDLAPGTRRHATGRREALGCADANAPGARELPKLATILPFEYAEF